MQLETTAPETIVQISNSFEPSNGRCCQNHPGPLKNICFRLLNLRAEIKKGDISDPIIIYNTAVQIDRDLQAWTQFLSSAFAFTTIEEAQVAPCFHGKHHVYATVAAAQTWNNWRTLRILVNQITLRHLPHYALKESDHLVLIINNLSTDICTSTLSFRGSPRKFPTVPFLISWSLQVTHLANILKSDCWAYLALVGCRSGTLEPLGHEEMGCRGAAEDLLRDGVSPSGANCRTDCTKFGRGI
jgi:hypothetical protein